MTKMFPLCFLLFYCALAVARMPTPKAGVWRFELRYPHVSIPFLLELEPGRRGWGATLINGQERIPLVVHVQKGLWHIPLQTYQNHLELNIRDKHHITGFFVKESKLPVEKVPLQGINDKFKRFDSPSTKPTINLTGKWTMELTNEKGAKTQAIALFDQQGSTLVASILTSEGDYRYIDGVVDGDKFLSGAFDGAFHFLFTGKLEGNTLKGELSSKTVSTFTARRDPKAALPDPYKMTQAENLSFSFPDTQGKMVSLADARFKDKAVVVQIFGSWCPNCIDETLFLGPWYEKNHQRGIEVVALSFERGTSDESALKHLAMVTKKREVPYPVLLASSKSEEGPGIKLPGLKNFMTFPTTIFLDRQHKVRKVHAGFSGPGTGSYYTEFQRQFDQTIDSILK